MVRSKFALMAALASVASFSGSASQARDPEKCRDAIAAYNSTVDDVSSALRRYSQCFASSRGTDDCSSEFSRLRSAQSDFESVVSNYEDYCE